MSGHDVERPEDDPLWRRVLTDVRQGRVPGLLRARQEGHFLLASARALMHPPQPRQPEIHVFVLWSNALAERDRILHDIAGEFVVRDVRCVSWPEADFSWNLTRFYGGTLPPRAEKERHCGTQPFLVVVVEDVDPVYRPRRTPKGIVNARTFDAKQRHRRWTGGGHRVHASLDHVEAEHDLFLLLGRRSADYRASTAPWDGVIASGPTEIVGAGGWTSASELLMAVEVATAYVLLEENEGRDGRPLQLELLVQNRTRAALTVNVPASRARQARHELLVGQRPAVLVLREVGDGTLARPRQRSLLRERVRDRRGVFVPAPARSST